MMPFCEAVLVPQNVELFVFKSGAVLVRRNAALIMIVLNVGLHVHNLLKLVLWLVLPTYAHGRLVDRAAKLLARIIPNRTVSRGSSADVVKECRFLADLC